MSFDQYCKLVIAVGSSYTTFFKQFIVSTFWQYMICEQFEHYYNIAVPLLLTLENAANACFKQPKAGVSNSNTCYQMDG